MGKYSPVNQQRGPGSDPVTQQVQHTESTNGVNPLIQTDNLSQPGYTPAPPPTMGTPSISPVIGMTGVSLLTTAAEDVKHSDW